MTHPLTEPSPPAALLTAEDEHRLAEAIEAGVLAAAPVPATGPRVDATATELRRVVLDGRAAWLRFVQANLGLVRVYAAREARRCQLPEADFFQEGCVALMVALQRFDHRRGVRFSTYAVPWIRAAVSLAAAQRCGEVDLPAHRAGELRRTRAAENALAVGLGRMPSAAEVGESLDRDAGWVSGVLAHRPARSLDHDADDLTGRLGVVDGVEERVLDQLVLIGSVGSGRSSLLDLLPPPERQVLALRFGFGGEPSLSRRETATRLGLGRKRVQLLEERGLDRLRRHLARDAA